MPLREDYASAFEAFDGVDQSEVHAGAFTADELTRLGNKRRSVYTTRLSFVVEDEGRRDRTLFGAYVICPETADVNGATDAAWLIARRIANHVAERDGIRVKARNIFSKATASRRATAWAVTWEVEEDGFDAGALDAELHDLEAVRTDFVHDGRHVPADTALPIDPPTDGDTAVTTDTTSP